MRGKIVLSDILSPHEEYIRDFMHKGAVAVVFYREGSFHPGFGMYITDGKDRSDLALPVTLPQASRGILHSLSTH